MRALAIHVLAVCAIGCAPAVAPPATAPAVSAPPPPTAAPAPPDPQPRAPTPPPLRIPLRYPDEVIAALRAHCAAALPAIWSAWDIPSPLDHLDADAERDVREHDAAYDPSWPCMEVVDGRSQSPPQPFVLVGVNVLSYRHTMLQVLAFRTDEPGKRAVGHAELGSFDQGKIVLRLEHFAGGHWAVLGTVDHPGSDKLIHLEEWFHLDPWARMTHSLSFVKKGALADPWTPYDQGMEGTIVWKGDRGGPAIDLQVRHTYSDLLRNHGDDTPPPDFVQEGKVAYRWDPTVLRFAVDKAHTRLPPEQAAFAPDATSILAAAHAQLAHLARSGKPAQKTAVRRVLDACARDAACSALPEYRRLRAVLP